MAVATLPKTILQRHLDIDFSLKGHLAGDCCQCHMPEESNVSWAERTLHLEGVRRLVPLTFS